MWKAVLCALVVFLGCGCMTPQDLAVPGQERNAMLSCNNESEFSQAFSFLGGDWRVGPPGLVGQGPLYRDLPQTNPEKMVDDVWTHYVVRSLNMWRCAVAGEDAWQDYTLSFTFRIEEPAPTSGYRPGESMYNYQWGREATGCDLGALVRYRGPDDYYMVRVSSGYSHVELWKTRGGVLRVKPYKFVPGRDYRMSVTASGAWILVKLDGKELMRYMDRADVIAEGKVGFGVRESRVEFRDVQVVPADLIQDAPPEHVPDFHLRTWVGRDYIFDGEEPVAYVGRVYGPILREVKLAPGRAPLMLIEMYPKCTVPDLAWEIAEMKVAGQGNRFALHVSFKEKEDRASGASRFTVHYEPGRGYVWEKKTGMTPKLDDTVAKWAVEVTDPYFYQLPVPATDKLPLCEDWSLWAVWTAPDGSWRRFPVSHEFYDTPRRLKEDHAVRPGGVWATALGTELAAVIEVLDDNPYSYYGEYCWWGHDIHIRVVGHDGERFGKGETFRGRVKYYAWDAGELAAAMLRAAIPAPGNLELMRFVYEEPVNTFRRQVPLASAHREQLWMGDYAADPAMGYGDGMCMRIQAGQSAQAHVGCSNWTGPYFAPRYKVSAWVKSDDLKGRVDLVMDYYTTSEGPKKESASLEVDGSTDWKRVELVTELPRNAYQWLLRLEVEGEGWAWIDDVAIVPLEAEVEQ